MVNDVAQLCTIVSCLCNIINLSEETGDGHKYRGRGAIQLTGKDAYRQFQDYYNQRFKKDVDLVAEPGKLIDSLELAIISAMCF